MENQYFILLIFIISGSIIGIIFDIFRIRRKLLKLPDFVTYIEDIIFWILTGVILIIVIFYIANGTIRLYHILGFLLGIFVYFISISLYIFKILNKISSYKVKILNKNKKIVKR